ncbi:MULTISPECIES: Na+/H+ antiporter subunit E [Pseudanabaena]|jgi:multicomponent Na+:H+ antiporter subunit E|uniref:Na+/H+ antiporter subunit E n=1 Tax=Pseudanabaena TaxID=1152 RepID=UPI0024797E21|nr:MULTISPECIES: Na+/H+ antiporter subunit E [Pseudanabaena]MEA5487962.1 Na+/H+ antiporter subunit E [Pseudanabaena sp. CCNP1317]WGS70953.1 Na+/H+ antiporter subunit E [Pseudanabaena galeata CCNP1313]
MIGQFILRIVIWFLLTANFSITNIIIGVIVSLLMPYYRSEAIRLKDILQSFGKILKATPQAYIESIEMICQPHKYEEVLIEKTKHQRSAALVFLDIFLITFTPKTIVLRHHEEGWYVVHHVIKRQKRSNP